jgi:hypothetical protein
MADAHRHSSTGRGEHDHPWWRAAKPSLERARRPQPTITNTRGDLGSKPYE